MAVAPDPGSYLAAAVRRGGGDVVDPAEAEGLVWTDPGGADELGRLLATAPGIRWVQLPWAGVERFAEAGLFADGRTWACGKGVYADPVAEMALALGLAVVRALPTYARARSWGRSLGESVVGEPVVVVGGGGIAESLLPMLAGLRCRTTVVRRRPAPMEHADRVVGADELPGVVPGARLVVLALALTPEVRGLVDAALLERIGPQGVLVNVARGGHVVTADLVAALQSGAIGGAGLDVTDPEPLPDGHPLWSMPNVVITPHTGNTPEQAERLLSARVSENVARVAAGRPLVGLVDPAAGY